MDPARNCSRLHVYLASCPVWVVNAGAIAMVKSQGTASGSHGVRGNWEGAPDCPTVELRRQLQSAMDRGLPPVELRGALKEVLKAARQVLVERPRVGRYDRNAEDPVVSRTKALLSELADRIRSTKARSRQRRAGMHATAGDGSAAESKGHEEEDEDDGATEVKDEAGGGRAQGTAGKARTAIERARRSGSRSVEGGASVEKGKTRRRLTK